MIPKFRAWDKKHARFTNYQIWDNMVFFYEKHLETWKRDDERDRFELMQSTGLKDINGVEIFEGDILNCGYLLAGSPFEELDYYEEEKGVVKIVNCGFNIKFKNDTNLLIDIMTSCDDVEVIGNIYENKDLLEE